MRTIDAIVAFNVLNRAESLGINQVSLAKRAGLTVSYLNKLIKSKKPISKSPALPVIAKALHVEEVELYQDTVVAECFKGAISDLQKFTKLLQEQSMETLFDYRELKKAYLELEKRLPNKDEETLLSLFRESGSSPSLITAFQNVVSSLKETQSTRTGRRKSR